MALSLSMVFSVNTQTFTTCDLWPISKLYCMKLPSPFVCFEYYSHYARLYAGFSVTTKQRYPNFTFKNRPQCLSVKSNMSWWYLRRLWLLLECAAYIIASNQTDQCENCPDSLKQTRYVPWAHLLKNETHHLSAIRFRRVRVLPNNSFVSAPFMKVCIGFQRGHLLRTYSESCLYRPPNWILLCLPELIEFQKAEIASKSKLVPSVSIKTHYWINHR